MRRTASPTIITSYCPTVKKKMSPTLANILVDTVALWCYNVGIVRERLPTAPIPCEHGAVQGAITVEREYFRVLSRWKAFRICGRTVAIGAYTIES